MKFRVIPDGKPMAVDRIRAVAAKAKVVLPEPYVSFVATVGSGVPMPDYLPYHQSGEARYIQFTRIINATGAISLRRELVRESSLDSNFIPIGINPDSDYLLLSQADGSAWLWINLGGDFPDAVERGRVIQVAESLQGALDRFTIPAPALPWAEHIYAHDTEGLARWLDAGGDPNNTTDEAVSPVTLAQRFGHADMVELVGRHGAKG